jgi:hypothetical protein
MVLLTRAHDNIKRLLDRSVESLVKSPIAWNSYAFNMMRQALYQFALPLALNSFASCAGELIWVFRAVKERKLGTIWISMQGIEEQRNSISRDSANA